MWHDPSAGLVVSGALICKRITDAEDFIRARRQVPRMIIVREDTADRVAQLALRLGDCLLVLDELDQVCAGKRWLSDAARDIVHYGRHKRIALMGGFRRTQNVHEDLLSQAHAAFVFRHSSASPRDVDALRDRLGRDFAARAVELEPMQFMVWRDD